MNVVQADSSSILSRGAKVARLILAGIVLHGVSALAGWISVSGTLTTAEWNWWAPGSYWYTTYPFSGWILDHVDKSNINCGAARAGWGEAGGSAIQGDARYAHFTGTAVLRVNYYMSPNVLVAPVVLSVHFTDGIADDAWPGEGPAGSPGVTGGLCSLQLKASDPSRFKHLGDPVQVATGAETDERTLFTLHGARDWNFTLSYNSLLAAAQLTGGAVGMGWSHPFETRLVPNGANLVLQWNGGRTNAFAPQPGSPGTYTSAEDGAKHDVITAQADGGWILTHRDQSTLRYNNAGRLIEDRDAHGRRLMLSYDTTGRIANIVDPISHAGLTFTYVFARLEIDTITDATGAVVSLGYAALPNSAVILTRITNQNRKQTTFTYNNDQRALLTVRDHLGTLLVSNTYDTLGRVVSQEDGIAGNRPLVFSYTEHGLPGGNLYAPSDVGRETPLILPDVRFLRTAEFTKRSGQTIHNSFDAQTGRLNSATVDGQTTTLSYDAQGNVASITDPTGQTSSVSPTISVAVTGRDGRRSTQYFDASYNFCAITNPLGATSRTAYDAQNNVVATMDALNRSQHFSYDSAGNLTSETDAAGKTTTHTYDDRNNLLTTTDALGQVVTRTYDIKNNLLTITDSSGATTAWTYDSNSLPLTKAAPGGGICRYAYTDGRVTQETDPTGVVTKFGYDADGRLTFREDAEGHRTVMVYDAVGNLLAETDALGRTRAYTYDHRNRLLESVDPTGAVTSYSYDNDGNLTAEIDPLGNATAYGYDGEGRMTAVSDALDQLTLREYDDAGRLATMSDPAGNKTTHEYDEAGQMVATVDPLGRRRVRSYDSNGLLKDCLDSLGRSSGYVRDQNGRVTAETDPLDRTTLFEYDALGRLTKATDGGGFVGRQVFDCDGNRVELTNPAAETTLFGYDLSGRLTFVTTPEARTTTFGFSGLGLLESVRGASGGEARTSYDAVGRVSQTQDAEGSISYVRDACGRALTVTERGKVLSRVYDPAGRVISYTDGEGNNLKYDHDRLGRVVRLVYPDGRAVTYDYNLAGRLSKVTDWATRETTYSYDAAGQLTQLRRPNGTKQCREYDAAGQLTRCVDYAPDGTTVIDSAEYDYDAGGQLTGALCTPASSGVAAGFVQSFDRDNRLRTRDGASIEFDADGNLTSAAPLTPGHFTYDARSRLTRADDTVYEYDAENHRTRISSAQGVISQVINPHASPDQTLVRTMADGAMTYYVYGLGLLYEEGVTGTRYYHCDRRGDTVALSDDHGAVTDRMSYGPFGELTSRSGSTPTPFLFNGYCGVQTDGNGLYYHRARYYHPLLRRFLTEDSVLGDIAKPGTLNRYAYTSGNPLSSVDPEGHFERDVHEGGPGQNYGTYTWATDLGFSVGMAARIGAADNRVDNRWSTSPYALPLLANRSGRSRHFKIPIDAPFDSRNVWAEHELQNAINAWRIGDYDNAMDALGRGLHSLQDVYAHGDFNNDDFPDVWHFDFARGWWAGEVDDWEIRKDTHKSVEDETKRYLRRYLEEIQRIKDRCS